MTQDEYNKKFIGWVRNHYWDSLEKDKNLILRHLRTFIGDKEIYETITISKREYFHLRRTLERYESIKRELEKKEQNEN